MKPGTVIAFIVFVLVALAHLLRLAFGVHVKIGTTEIPVWVSVVGVVVALALAGLLLCEARGACKGKEPKGVGRASRM